MKINKLTKRIVSFITALSLSVSSTVMVLPASAFADNTLTNGYYEDDDTDFESANITGLDEEDGGDNNNDPTYIDVTASPTEHGSVQIAENNPAVGDKVNFYVTPDTGYEIGTVSVTYGNNQSVTCTKIDGEDKYYFSAPSENATISVTFVAYSFTAEYTSTDTNGNTAVITKKDGTALNDNGTFTIEDLPLTVTYNAINGYESDVITIYENKDDENNIYTQRLNGTASVTLDSTALQINDNDSYGRTRYFEFEFAVSQKQYNITLAQSEHGYVEIAQSAKYRDEVNFTNITPAQGYELEITATYMDADNLTCYIDILYYDNDPDSPYFVMPAYDVYVTVTFKAKDYTIINDSDSATIKVTSGNYQLVLDKGENATIDATRFPLTLTATGIGDEYAFDKWIITNGEGYTETEQTTTITEPTDWDTNSITISANLKSKPFSITADPDSDFIIAPYGNTTDLNECYANINASFTISVPDGYVVKNVKACNGDDVINPYYDSEGNYYYFTMPAGDIVIKADVVELPDVTASATNGTITAYGDSSFTNVVPGEKVYFTLNPNDGYFWDSDNFASSLEITTATKIITWESEWNNDSIEVFAFEMPEEDVTITVTFPEKTKWVVEDGTYSITYRENYPAVPLEIPLSELIAEGKDINEIESITLTHTDTASFDICIKNVPNALGTGNFTTETSLNLEDKEISIDDVILIYDIEFANRATFFTISNITVNYKKYDVTAGSASGEITVSSVKAAKGDTVTVTVTPENGYKLKKLYYTYMQNNIEEAVIIENNEFVMPGFSVIVHAEYEQYALSVSNGDVVKYCDTWAEFVSLCDGDFQNADITLTIYKDIALAKNEKLPSKVNGIIINGSGKLTLDNSVKTLNIPVDTTLNVTIESANKLDITVAADTSLTIGADFNLEAGINKLSGGRSGSKLYTNKKLYINQLSSFSSVNSKPEKQNWPIFVSGTVTSIDSFYGDIRLTETSEIGYAEEGSIIRLVLKEDGSLPKLTLTDSGNIKVQIAESFAGFAYDEVVSGTTVLYTKGNDLSDKITIQNNYDEDSESYLLSAVYYGKTKEIRAENLNLITVSWGENGSKNFSSLENVVEFINNPLNDDGGIITAENYYITLNEEATANTSFAFPTKNKNVQYIAINGQPITFTGTKLNIPYEVSFGSKFKVSNKNNYIDIAVADKARLYFAEATANTDNDAVSPYINNLTGKRGSVLEGAFDAVKVSGFGTVDANTNIYGNMSNIGNFSGILNVHGEKTTVDITNILGDEAANNITTMYLYRNSENKIPKVTIGSISKEAKLDVSILDSENNSLIECDETILYTKNGNFAENGELISNISIGDSNLSAFYYSKTKSIKAEYADAITLSKKSDDNWEAIQNFPNLDAVVDYINNTEDTASEYKIYVNAGYSVTISANFAFPTKNKNVKSIELSCSLQSGVNIFTGTKLNIPYDVNLNLNKFKVSNKNNLMDITVANGATLKFSMSTGYYDSNQKYVPYINKITGTGSANLVCLDNLTANDISGFENVITNYSVVNINLYGTMSKIGNFSGTLKVLGEKSTVDITNVYGNSAFYLYENSKGVLPKVTIASISKLNDEDKVTPSLSITACDNSGNNLALNGGETLLYTKDNKFAKDGMLENVTIGNGGGFSAFYYSKTKSIKAEYADAITLSKRSDGIWDEIQNFPNLDAVVDYINGNTEDPASEYMLNLNKAVTASTSFAFPTKNKNVKSIEVSGKPITFTGTKLNIPYDVTFDNYIMASNKNNYIDITVAKNVTLSIKNCTGETKNGVRYPYINKLTGQGSSKLWINKIYVNSISGFEDVSFASSYDETDAAIILLGTMSKIANFNGNMHIIGEKSTVDITNIYGASNINLCENSKCVLPKVTIGSISKLDKNDDQEVTPSLKVEAYDNSLDSLDLASGRTILYTKDNKFADVDKIKIINGSYDYDSNTTYGLSAFYYSKTKSIKAEVSDAVTLSKHSSGKWVIIQDFPSLEAAVDYINGNTEDTASDYKLYLNKPVTASASFAFPTKNKNVKCITVDGLAITFTGTKLNIPYEVEIGNRIEASNKNNYIDITVAKNVKLSIHNCLCAEKNGVYTPYINKITGQSGSYLYCNSKVVNGGIGSISGFETVIGSISLYGTMSKVANFTGMLTVCGEKSTVDITNIYGASNINLCENSKGVLPKVTIGSISKLKDDDNADSKLAIDVIDANGKSKELPSGETVLYTKDNKFADVDKIKIVINSYVDGSNTVFPFSAFYYSKTKSIKAEYADAITLYKKSGDNWETIQNFQNLDAVVDYINNTEDTASEYDISLNKPVTASTSFAFPTKNKNVKSIEVSGKPITFTGTKLNIPYDVTFDNYIMASNKNNYIDITVAKNVTLTLYKSMGEEKNEVFYPYINKLTGQSGSKLHYNNLDVNNISGFENVSFALINAASGDGINLLGTMSKVSNFTGILKVCGEKSTVDITNVYDESRFSLYENSKGVLPKVTIGSISKLNDDDTTNPTLMVIVGDNSGDSLDLASGRTILYTKDNKFADADRIKILNNQYVDNGKTIYPLSASYDSKTKTIKAVNESAVMLYEKQSDSNDWGNEVKNYSTFEEAVAYINQYGNANTDYRIYVAETVECSKFALPNTGKAHKVYVETLFNYDDYSSINIGSTSTITANTDVDINAWFNYTGKTLTLNAKGNVDIGEKACFNKITGTTKNTLKFYEENGEFLDISGFGTVQVNDSASFTINTTFSTNKLVLGENAGVFVSENMKSGSFTELTAANNAYIYYLSISCKPLTFKGKAENFKIEQRLKIKGNIGHGSKVLSTKALADPNDYLVPDLSRFNADAYFKQVGNDICLYGKDCFQVNNNTFESWTDVINYINTANDPNATYSITMPNVFNANGALTFPKKGTYSQLKILNSEITFTGTLKLTGNTYFSNVTLNSIDSSGRIDGTGYDVTFEMSNAPLASITAKNINILAYDRFTASQIKASEKLTLEGISQIIVLDVKGGIEAKDLECSNSMFELSLESGKKINITERLLFNDSDYFVIKLVDKNSKPLTTISNNYSIGTIKNSNDIGKLSLSNDGYKLSYNEKTGAVTVVPKTN